MEFTILQKNFKQGLGLIERISQKSLTLPILNNVLVSAQDNFLNLRATDLEVGVNWWTLAKVRKEGRIAVPVKILAGLVGLLPNQALDLTLDKRTLTLKCGEHWSRIKGSDPKEFPSLPQPKEKKTLVLEGLSLAKGLTQVLDIVAPSLARPAISGVYFNFQKDVLKLVATDSFRLAEKRIILREPVPEEVSFILPQKAARELITIFGEKQAEIKVYLGPNQVLFELPMKETDHPQVHLVSKLIEGQYPNYQEIIPQGFKTQALLSRKEFLGQIKRASLFSGKINEVKFSVDLKKPGLEVLSQNLEAGEYRSFLRAKIKGEKIETSFNHRFLADGLAKIKSPDLIFEMNGPEGPGLLKPVRDKDYLYIVMPIKPS